MSEELSKRQSTYKLVVDTDEQTVLSKYEPLPKDEEGFQSEAALEQRLIDILVAQGVARLPIRSEDELVANLRSCMEELNAIAFSDSEWGRFFKDYLSGGHRPRGRRGHRHRRGAARPQAHPQRGELCAVALWPSD